MCVCVCVCVEVGGGTGGGKHSGVSSTVRRVFDGHPPDNSPAHGPFAWLVDSAGVPNG